MKTISRGTAPAPASSLLLLLLAALCATFAMERHGHSCGHDFDFHLQSWLDAARQLHGGTIYPRWVFSAAYNAGEPRFVFYPPLSWMLGAALTLTVPFAAAPAIYLFIALTAAGLAMHHVARQFVTPNAALLAAALYLANPYMLFNAVERSAYAELLSAAWIPLLFLSVLRTRPTIPGVAIPVALLWLTNAPAAVMGCYTLAFLAAIRFARGIILSSLARGRSRPDAPSGARANDLSNQPAPGRFLATIVAGTLLGLALPAFYLLPAAYQRRYVQITAALESGYQFHENFLFGHDDDEPLHTASVLAVTLLGLTAASLVVLLVRRRGAIDSAEPEPKSSLPLTLLLVTALIFFLLIPASAPLWRHLPELAFLQFPWRLLTILAAVLALAVALLLDSLRPALIRFSAFAAPACALALGFFGVAVYWESCDEHESATEVLQLFLTHHGVESTEEYTPKDADSDFLRTNNPAYWLSPDPAAFAPDTLPNPSLADPDFDGPVPVENTISAPAPPHLVLDLAQPETLILNLRDFPDWCVLRNGQEFLPRIHRNDGLIALALPGGPSTIDIVWRRTLDQKLGLGISGGALVLFGLGLRLNRRPKSTANDS